jgi:hypothetical protein
MPTKKQDDFFDKTANSKTRKLFGKTVKLRSTKNSGHIYRTKAVTVTVTLSHIIYIY